MLISGHRKSAYFGQDSRNFNRPLIKAHIIHEDRGVWLINSLGVTEKEHLGSVQDRN
jgi:hypothetical protein